MINADMELALEIYDVALTVGNALMDVIEQSDISPEVELEMRNIAIVPLMKVKTVGDSLKKFGLL